MTALLRPGRVFLLAMLAASAAACDFGKVSAPTAPDQSNVPFSYTDLTVGTGATATAGNTVTVTEGAWLYSESAPDHKGVQIDTGTTFSFVLGTTPTQVIPGFDMGVTGMKVSGTRRVIVPPSLAYGSTGYQTIPANSALTFDIALTAVTAPQ